MRAILLLTLLVLAACGRPLSPSETRFARLLHGPSLDTSQVRLIPGVPFAAMTIDRPRRPRLTCRERIVPEPKTIRVTVSPAAAVLNNTIWFDNDWYLRDYLPEYPARMHLGAAMLLAHELVHVWQWQNRAVTGYSPFKAAREHKISKDPYLFDLATRTAFLDYPYEQQASIVEEYVCCAALDPEAPRTGRLERLIKGAIPMQRLRLPDDIILPWDGAQTSGICR